MKRHARQVGEIVYAWNSALGALFWVFWVMLGKGQPVAHGIWHTIQNDRAQLQMLEQLAEKSEAHSRSIKKAVLWTVSAMTGLISFRNDAAHVQMSYYYKQLNPSEVTSRSKSLERLSKSPVEQYWRKMRGDLRAIELYAMDLHVAIMAGKARPLTKRPRLQLDPAKRGKNH
jgi:hypothetical protein